MEGINSNRKIHKEHYLTDQLNKIFDIAKCQCQLLSYPCHHRLVKCLIENSNQDHIVCVCGSKSKVPSEERPYLRDQRARDGDLGKYQMSTPIFRRSKSFIGHQSEDTQALGDVSEHNLSSDCSYEVSKLS